MLHSYFFIPANNPGFISKIAKIEADNFIFDLEDSLSKSEIESGISNLANIKSIEKHFVRPAIICDEDGDFDFDIFEQLVNIGFTKFIIPKLYRISDLRQLGKDLLTRLQTDCKKLHFILLVEHPACLMSLKEIISEGILNLIGLALGSHDYCNQMNMKHTLDNLAFPRQVILNIAKANNLTAIDIASVNVTNIDEFSDECYHAFSMGFDGKFILHPLQLEALKKVKYYSEVEIEEAHRVFPLIKSLGYDEFKAIKINGKVFERPHLKRILRIISWYEEFGKSLYLSKGVEN